LSLVAAARTGDRAALDALLRRHHDRWWRLCRRLLGNDSDAADALQEGLIAVARGIRRYDGRAAFTTWAYRVVTNACLDEMRRRARRPVLGAVALFPDGGGGASPVTSTSTLAAFGPAAEGPDPGIEAVAGRLDVDAAVAQLPPEFRAAVVLRDLCDLDYAEIARVLDIPAGTVRSRIARGRALLCDLLGNRAPAPDRPTTQP
jgi:RNA polymerase sigma-70 factor (ECF subfamily)